MTATGGGTSGATTLTVAQAAASVVVTPSNPTLTAFGATQAFAAEAFDANGASLVTQPTFTWTSGDQAVATVVGGTGVATAVANGSAAITATGGGTSGNTTLTVSQVATSIVVSPANPTLTAFAATQAFTAEAFDANGSSLVTQPAFAWTSSDVAIAMIDAGTGVATAVADGSVTITASAMSTAGTSTLTVTLPSAAQTTAVVPGGTVGSPTTVTITVRDANGNVRTVGGDGGALAVTVTGANSAAPTVSDAGGGTYTASYTPTSTGTDDIAITLNSVPISGSSFTSAVGNPVPTISTVSPDNVTSLEVAATTITGTGFVDGATTVTFDDLDVLVAAVTVASPTQITATITYPVVLSADTRTLRVTTAAPGGGSVTHTVTVNP
jgi:hypothetical protein